MEKEKINDLLSENPKSVNPSIEKQKESRKEIQLSIIEKADGKTDDSIITTIERENLKIQLKGGLEIDLAELDVVSNKMNDYEPRFPNEFYVQIFRLTGRPIPKSGVISEKPHIVGTYTKEIIYNRFDKDVLPTLEYLNPYERIGIRRHKHFQFLSEKGLEMLSIYIEQSIELMKECESWYEFRVELLKKHGVPFQMDMFKEAKMG